MKRRFFQGLLSAVLLVSTGICSPPNLDFSGTWKLSNERSTRKRTDSIRLRIKHRDPDLMVETTSLRNSGPPRYAVQRCTTDGTTSVSIGSDGDEFHTAVVWNGPCLVFSVEEHEEGRIIFSKETWTLIDHGTALQRVRDGLDASSYKAERQTLIYIRQSPQT